MDNRFLCRGKRLDNGEWVIGCLYYFNHESNPSKDIRAFIILPNGLQNNENEFEVIPATIGQCTGLHVAKSHRGESEADRLIFEGDIVKYQLGGNGSRWQKSVIVWGEKTTSFCFDSEDKGYCLDVVNNVEITGTIHDKTEREG